MATDNKYDRQLRLWGSHGQRLLSESRVCLLGAGATGAETLKNLVLPGLGSFLVVDDKRVSDTDLTNNFFVTKSSLGKPIAKEVTRNLVEMNEDVSGDFLETNPLAFIQSADRQKEEFSLVIASSFAKCEIGKVASVCSKLSIPLVVIRSYGLIGYIRIYSPEICVVESKPSPEPAEDIRIANPFPKLLKYATSICLEELDEKSFKHVPYVIILIQLLQTWKKQNNGLMPSTVEEKNKFREKIKEIARLPWGEEENLEEALNLAYMAFKPRPIPYDVDRVLADSTISKPNFKASPNLSNFWLMARALKLYVEDRGRSGGFLPLSGKLPDMTSTTEMYIRLQEIYQEKASEDLKTFSNMLDKVLEEAGLESTIIPSQERALFCKSATFLQVNRFRSFDQEYCTATANKDAMMMAVMEGVGDSSPQCPLVWYFALRACDKFYEKYGRYPGDTKTADLRKDTELVHSFGSTIVDDTGIEVPFTKDHASEMVRFGAAELHNIAALMGGIASQEIVKLLTRQYTPLNNTYIYNGITCSGAVYEL
mmetsp:Transcript_1601/g.1884  ORF Transcript_1601/g.1884 Transcript_1601/m.1884 type:complete len:539 (-) Transcript_1601:553-2169(-)